MEHASKITAAKPQASPVQKATPRTVGRGPVTGHEAQRMAAQRKLQEMAYNSAGVRQFAAMQQMANESAVQRKSTETRQELHKLVQKKINNRSLPNNLKAGVKNLGSLPMDGLKVHYNSEKLPEGFDESNKVSKFLAPFSGVIQRRLQAKQSSWNPRHDPSQFFTSVKQNLNKLSYPGALVYSTNGILFKTLDIKRSAIHVSKNPHPLGTKLITRLINSPKTTTIIDTNTNLNAATPKPPNNIKSYISRPFTNGINAHKAAVDPLIGADVDVTWNPNLPVLMSTVPVFNTHTGVYESQATPPRITLGHELGHADRFNRGVGKTIDPATEQFPRGGYRRNINVNPLINGNPTADKDAPTIEEVYNIGLRPQNQLNIGINYMIPNPDAKNTITENDLRNEQGLAARVGYFPHAMDQ